MGTAGQSVTLANSIIGVGILAMPFCFQQCGVILATLILLFMGLVSRLCSHFLLKSALLARRRNFEFLAFHVFGSVGKLAVEVGIIGFLMGTCIAYFVVVGDLGPQIISKMFNINQSDILRTSIMLIVSLVCVLPLGLLRNVDSLSNVSAATICFYFCLVMKVIAEAASQLWTGEWQSRVEMWRPSGVLQCVPIFSMALFCQTQLFEIFESLPSLSLEKMNRVTKNAINICTGVYFTLGVFGYIAFCTQAISGNILMSLSPTMASDVIKLGFVMSLAFSFPLIIFPCRASLYSFLYKKVHAGHHEHALKPSIPARAFRVLTVCIVGAALGAGLAAPHVERVLGVLGATVGVLVCLVFPAAAFLHLTYKNTNERLLAKGIVVLGLIIMVLGTYANLQASETQLDRIDDKHITQERIDKIVEDFFEKRDKLEEVRVDPLSNNDPNPISSHSIKDYEVQPPNPVPPDSSIEKLPDTHVDNKEEKILKELPKVKKEDKVSESHPRDVKTKLNEAKFANGNTNENNKEEIPKKSEEAKTEGNEDKIHIIKQQKLIETIKQHGEEQKELMKEQKEILDEIIKTKKELQENQNKNEADDNEAKKRAVESIKQIANMAIQSIGGVTEKPINDEKDNKKSERLEKLTNEAVKEIAKKAVETIEAIKEIEKPDESVQKPNGHIDVTESAKKPVIPDVAVLKSAQINKQANQNFEPIQKVKEELSIQNNNQPDMNQQPSVAKQNNRAQLDLNEQKSVIDKSQNLNKKSSVMNSQPSDLKPVTKENAPQIKSNDQQQNSPQIEHDLKKPVRTHSHSPDEPQSYKQGEDSQIPVAKPMNLPLPLVINDMATKTQAKNMEEKRNIKIPDAVESKMINKGNIGAENSNNNLKPNIDKNQLNVRLKREVVDNIDDASLRAEDKKEICNNFIDIPEKNSQEILPKVDLSDIAMNKIPLDILHRVGRSLKDYDGKDKER